MWTLGGGDHGDEQSSFPCISAATDHSLPPSAGTQEGKGHWAGWPQPGKLGASPSGGASTVLALLPKCPFWHFLPWGNWKGEEGGGVVCNNRVFAPTQLAPLPIPRHTWICWREQTQGRKTRGSQAGETRALMWVEERRQDARWTINPPGAPGIWNREGRSTRWGEHGVSRHRQTLGGLGQLTQSF